MGVGGGQWWMLMEAMVVLDWWLSMEVWVLDNGRHSRNLGIYVRALKDFAFSVCIVIR